MRFKQLYSNAIGVVAALCLLVGIYDSPEEKSALMQEICDNAIDDDGDGYVDLNDSDCECKGLYNDSLGFYLSNPSFEDRRGCPAGPNELRNLYHWSYVNPGVDDSIYGSPHDTCGYVGDDFNGYSPRPYADGISCVALTGSKIRKEFLMAELNTPLWIDSSYTLGFSLGLGVNGNGYNSVSPVTVAVYGRKRVFSRANVAYSGLCPDKNEGWQVLDSVTIGSQEGSWVRDSFVFVNSSGIIIDQILIGHSCNNLDGNSIYYLDDLSLKYKEPSDLDCRPVIYVFNSFCSFGVQEYWLYFRNDLFDCRTGQNFNKFQWFRDGVAFNVTQPLKLLIAPLDSLLGHTFQLRFQSEEGCVLSNKLFFDPESYAKDTIYSSTSLCPEAELAVFDSIITSPGIYHFVDCGQPYEFEVLPDSNVYKFITDTTCSSLPYSFMGEQLDSTGVFTFSVNRRQECDSIIVLDLTVIDTSKENLSAQICSGQQYESGGQFFNATGNYQISLTTQGGCDSLILLDLQVIDTITENITTQICDGENYSAGGQNFTQSGNYEIPLKAAGGCDSLILLDLTVLDSTLENRAVKICEGEQYDIGGQSFTTTGVYPVVLTRNNTCDSTIIVDLEVSDGVTGIINITDSISCYDRSDARIELILDPDSHLDLVNLLWNTGDTTRVLEDLDPGIYEVEITDDANCTNTVSVEIPEPDSLQLLFEKTDVDCNQADLGRTIKINPAMGGTAPYAYYLDNDIVPDIAQTINGLDSGQYLLSVVDWNNCERDTLIQINDQRPDGSVDLMVSNANPVLGEEVTLDLIFINITAPYTIRWSGQNVSCDTCISTMVRPIEGTSNYSAVITDAFGCSYEVSTQFTINPSIFIPNAFTPNEDGRNDYFTLYADASIESIDYLRIYNRLGDLIYHITDIVPNEESLGWDGKFQGLLQNPGVYVYVIQYRDGAGVSRVVSGDVTLLR